MYVRGYAASQFSSVTVQRIFNGESWGTQNSWM
jgi:hypothetical protein